MQNILTNILKILDQKQKKAVITDYLDRALILDPESSEALHQYTLFYKDLRQYNKAHHYLNRLSAINIEEASFLDGVIFFTEKNYTAAINSLSKLSVFVDLKDFHYKEINRKKLNHLLSAYSFQNIGDAHHMEIHLSAYTSFVVEQYLFESYGLNRFIISG